MFITRTFARKLVADAVRLPWVLDNMKLSELGPVNTIIARCEVRLHFRRPVLIKDDQTATVGDVVRQITG